VRGAGNCPGLRILHGLIKTKGMNRLFFLVLSTGISGFYNKKWKVSKR
jgi:hypothetical protein